MTSTTNSPAPQSSSRFSVVSVMGSTIAVRAGAGEGQALVGCQNAVWEQRT